MSVKAIRVTNKTPELVDLPRIDNVPPDHVRVDIVSSSICGSDLHLIDLGFAEGRVLGHEFAGRTPDGTAVAVEPMLHCGTCAPCNDGLRGMCSGESALMGVMVDGGMATEIVVPTSALVELPSGIDIANASLVEPLAVATHAVLRSNLKSDERVLVLGAGPIGLATAAVLADREHACDISARHAHQQEAAVRLGASIEVADGYDVVIDAVGSTDSIRQAVRLLRPRGRLVMVASFWEPVSVDMGFLMKEIDLRSSSMYGGIPPQRDFDVAARTLANNPAIVDALITHRFPLDGATEAFETAANRAAGAIKVVFEI